MIAAAYMRDTTVAGKSNEDIVCLLDELRNRRGPVLERMRETLNVYNGDVVIPLPELDEAEKAAIPNLLATGLDGMAGRIASTQPGVFFPPTADGRTATARKRARLRRDVVTAWWDASEMDLRRYRIARHYCGFGTFNLYIRPSLGQLAPSYEIRNPLTTYPISEPDEAMATEAVIFTSMLDGKTLAKMYPGIEYDLAAIAEDRWSTMMWERIEYVDRDEWVFVARLPADSYNRQPHLMQRQDRLVRLDRLPNRIGACPVILGGRFGLDRVMGQFEQMTGMYHAQGALQALDLIAVRKGIFPDLYLEGDNPRVLTPASGIKGVIGRVAGGSIHTVTMNPGMQTTQAIDRIERNARVTGGIPPEFSGESSTNVRTGRRGDNIMSSTVDFRVQEAQVIMARALQKANDHAIAIDREYFGPRKKTIYVGSRDAKTRREDEYTPNDLWSSTRHTVTYSHPGSDTNQLTIAALQLVGASMMSKQSAMELHPMIDDAEVEHDRIQAEVLEGAMVGAIAQQAAQGQIPPADVARIMQLIRDDELDLADAVQKVHEEMQARQATAAPAGSPETMPGAAQPGMGAEQPTIAPPPEGSRNLLSLMTATRMPQRAIAGEAGNSSQISGILPQVGGE